MSQATESGAETAELPPGAEGAVPAVPEEQGGAEGPAEGQDEASPKRGRRGPGADLDDDELAQRVLALLFASPEPLAQSRLVGLLERPEPQRVAAALAAIPERLRAAGLPLELRALAGGYTLMTVPEMGAVVARLSSARAVERISPAALETLAVVAYRQPVTKAEIEAIRGVQAGPILRSLVDRGLARVVGRADVPGHPLQYATTKEFLDRFGLMAIEDLPRDSELTRD